jgi:alpha-galactosidase
MIQQVCLDEGWASMTRDAAGDLQPDPAKFPDGIKPLADYVHSLGLKFGMYSTLLDLGYSGFRTGSKGHIVQDAKKFAGWGVDFLKYDGVFQDAYDGARNASYGEDLVKQESYARMGAALQSTGRPIIYNVSAGTAGRAATFEVCGGNQTRYGTDIGPWWKGAGRGIDDYFDITTYPQYAGPGHCMDPDQLMIGSGTAGEYTGIPTDVENRTQFAVWCMWAAPLLFARSPAELTTTQLAILKNTAMIAIDQDPMGIMAIRTKYVTTSGGEYDVWARPLGTATGTVNSWAICIVNRAATTKTITATWADIVSAITTWQSTMATYPTFAAPSAVTLTDLSGNGIAVALSSTTGFIATSIPSHGCVVIKVTP